MRSSQLIAGDTLDQRSLRRVMALLQAQGMIARTASALDAREQATNAELRKSVLGEVAAFSASGNPEIIPSLGAHIAEHSQEIRRLFAGGDVGEFAFVATHARRRAEQRFPLEATLHAYRCGHRVFSHWLRDAVVTAGLDNGDMGLSAVADFAIEYTNTISSIVTAEYVARTRILADAESDRRSELMNILLSGYDESDGRVARLLKRSGYLEHRQTYCVAVAQSVHASEMEHPERAQRIADAVSAALADLPIRVLTGIRSSVVVAVLSDTRRQSGWTAPQTALAERLRPRLLTLGTAVLIGTSTDQPSTSFLPRALQEATLALDFATIARRVVQFSDLPIRSLMLHRGGGYVRSVAPMWVAVLLDADARANGALIETLRVVADADLNLQKAGRQLGVHPNTIYARLGRIKEMTGLDGQRHHDLVELLLAADSAPR